MELHDKSRLTRTGFRKATPSSAWSSDRLPRVVAAVAVLLLHLVLLLFGVSGRHAKQTPHARSGDVLEVRFIDLARAPATTASRLPLDPSVMRGAGRHSMIDASNASVGSGKHPKVAVMQPVADRAPIGDESWAHDAKVLAPSADKAGDEKHGPSDIGSYIQVRPGGNSQVMNRVPGSVTYRPTRFEKDWTPDHETSLETALHRIIEDSTVHRTWALPGGMRADCSAGPITSISSRKVLMLASAGCSETQPPKPSTAAEDAMVSIQTLAPARPLAPNLAPAIASTVPLVPGGP